MTTFDVVVIGQGLAGTALVWHLLNQNVSIGVIDGGREFSASRIAAGLINPITGRRLAASWRFADFWPKALQFYLDVERQTRERFFRLDSSVRLFTDRFECLRLSGRELGNLHFLGISHSPDINPEWFDQPFGCFEMTPAGRLDCTAYLTASREHFIRSTCFCSVELDLVSDLEPQPDGVRFPRLGWFARRVVFCQGYTDRPNPWFAGVTFNPVKGEYLTLSVAGLAERRVVIRGVALVPMGNGLFRAGATYDRSSTDPTPTQAGADWICTRVREFLRLPFGVIDHQAGVRPIIRESRPVLGVHPRHPRLAYFNGLGSKGVLVAPYFAAQLADRLTGRGRIEPDADVTRYCEGG
jgi:glycine oxidase